MTTSWGKFLFWFYLLFLVVADATVTNPADPDLWHRLAFGEVFWQTGHFPTGFAHSYLASYEHPVDFEAGSGILFYLCYLAGGMNIFVLVKLLTLGLTLGLVAAAGLQDRRPSMFLAAYYAVVLMALLSSFGSTVRCMTFTHVLLALWLYWYQRERHGRAVPTWLYPLTMVLWANLHGAFVTGLVWLFLVGVTEAWCGGDWRRWAWRLGLSSLATVINPYGFDLWMSTLRALTTSRKGFAEWAPVPWWSETYLGYKLLLFVVVIVLVIHLFRRGLRGIDWRVAPLVGAFLVLSLSAARHTSIFAIAAGALIPTLLPRQVPETYESNPLRRLGLTGLRMTAVIFPLFSVFIFMGEGGLHLSYPSNSCPVGAVDYLREQKVTGNLLVPFNYGSYALWELRDQMKVSMDGRYEIAYTNETYHRVDDFFRAQGDWQDLLVHPQPDAILVPVEEPVYAKLKALPGWREAWHGPTDAVFLPKG